MRAPTQYWEIDRRVCANGVHIDPLMADNKIKCVCIAYVIGCDNMTIEYWIIFFSFVVFWKTRANKLILPFVYYSKWFTAHKCVNDDDLDISAHTRKCIDHQVWQLMFDHRKKRKIEKNQLTKPVLSFIILSHLLSPLAYKWFECDKFS